MNNRYKFSVYWFDYLIHLWEQILSKYKDKPNLNFLEIGSFEGRSAVWTLENILTDKSSKITCIDTFEGSFEHNVLSQYSCLLPTLYDTFIHNISYFPNQVIVKRGKSQDVLKELREHKGHYDMMYIDGDHTASAVLEDAILSFPLLKKYGILIFDDYNWGIDEQNPNKINLRIPRNAIDAFLQIYADKINILYKDCQVIVEKLCD